MKKNKYSVIESVAGVSTCLNCNYKENTFLSLECLHCKMHSENKIFYERNKTGKCIIKANNSLSLETEIFIAKEVDWILVKRYRAFLGRGKYIAKLKRKLHRN